MGYSSLPSSSFHDCLPAAWQHQVGHSSEQPFAGPIGLNQQQQPPRKDANINLLRATVSNVQPLSEYHLAVPAPAGSQVLHLVSYAGLQAGDILLIEQGTLHQEMRCVCGFGSIVLAAPLRHDHPIGSQVLIARAYQTGTPVQHQAIRHEAGRHHHRANRVLASHGALSESVDSLEGFVAKDALSDAERAHQEERHRRKGRLAQRPVVRALPAPPV